MLSAALLLLSNSLFLTLHLSGNPGSFPRPLTRQEERECLERWGRGDLSARNRLVEHNLRLVAHIIKKTQYKMQHISEWDPERIKELPQRTITSAAVLLSGRTRF